MKTSKRSLAAVLIGLFAFAGFAFSNAGGGDWPVPDEFKNKKNPVAADKESLDIGKALYAKHCQSCHGKYGEGDGPKAGELKTEMHEFASDAVQKQTDGSLFYKIKVGRDEMPGFEKKITDDEEIWSIVNYLRTLAE